MTHHTNIPGHWNEEVDSFCSQSNAVVMALLDASTGKLLSGNRGFKDLMKGEAHETLINPSFDKLNAQVAQGTKQSPLLFQGLITLGHLNAANNLTIQGNIWAKQGQMLILGASDPEMLHLQNQRLTELNHHISSLQRQLTREKFLLQNTLKKLQEANNQLAILNEEKNRFLHMAAHDLRNPISAAISYTDILTNNPQILSPEKQKSFLTNIDERLRFALQLMTELLDVSKMEAGELGTLNIHNGNYSSLLKKTVEFNQMVANYKNIDIELHLPSNPIWFFYDNNKLEQALNNLISNAIKYSHPGSTVIIEARQNSEKTLTSITDHGLGIKEEELPFIFQPFHKSSNQPTAGESSTGLGLPITKKIVEEHLGHLEVSSQEGRGSCFTVHMPNIIQPKSSK